MNSLQTSSDIEKKYGKSNAVLCSGVEVDKRGHGPCNPYSSGCWFQEHYRNDLRVVTMQDKDVLAVLSIQNSTCHGAFLIVQVAVGSYL